MADPDLEFGEKIEHYEIRGLLGRGGMGSVYLAFDHSLGRKVALKILPVRLSEDADIVARFQREARAMAALRHPNLMHVYGVGTHGGRPYFTMEYVRGATLGKLIANSGRIEPARAVRLVREILSALDKVHASGIIHRDIKSGNVMMDEDGRAILMDFGLARQERDAALTADHTVLGTPAYMSPEQAKGETLNALTDIYSLGIVFFEMLTGAQPFKGKTSFEVLRQQIETPVPPPSRLEHTVPACLDRIVKKATAKSPAHRYQSAQEMAADLAKLSPSDVPEGDEQVLTAKTMITRLADRGFFARAWSGIRWFFGHRWRAAAAGAVAVVLAVILFLPHRQHLPPPGSRVRLERENMAPIEGRLVEIQVLDDGTTPVIIETATKEMSKTSVRDGDRLLILPDR